MLVVIAKDPTQRAALTEMATDAQASIKRGDVAQASAGIDILREAIGDEEAQVAGGAVGAAPVKPNGAAHEGSHGNDQAQQGREIMAHLTHVVKQAAPMAASNPALGGVIKSTVATVQRHVSAGNHEAASDAIAAFQQQLAGISTPFGQFGGAAGSETQSIPAESPSQAESSAQAPGQFAVQSGALAGAKIAAQQAPAAHPHAEHHAHAAEHAPVIETGIKVWTATRKKIEDEVEGLHKAFHTALQGHGMQDDLVTSVRKKVDGTMKHLDDSLSHTLAAINKASGPEERAKHVQVAHETIQQHRKHVASDTVIKMIDNNPFSPTNIRKLVETSLAGLAKSIR